MNYRTSFLVIGVLGAHLIQNAIGQQATASSMDGWAARHRQGQESIPDELKKLRDEVPQGHLVPVGFAIAEIQRAQEEVATREYPGESIVSHLRSPGHASRMFAASENRDPFGDISFPGEPYTGPLEEINLASGELSLVKEDIGLPPRGGLGLVFRRSYRSYRDYDGPLGKGWDHNHNQRLMLDAYTPNDSKFAEWHFGGGSIQFMRDGDVWNPQKGAFYRLEFPGPREAVIQTREGLRYVFQRLNDAANGGSQWRLGRVTTLHSLGRKTWANELVYEYQPGSSRLVKIRDPYGKSLEFGYDEFGRITGIKCGAKATLYSYDVAGRLISVVHPSVALTLFSVADLTEQYAYAFDAGGHDVMVGYTPIGQEMQFRYEYEATKFGVPGRVVRVMECARSGGIVAEWSVQYHDREGERVVSLRPPRPGPEQQYVFHISQKPDGKLAPSARLPQEISFPGRDAVWRYSYNDDGLVTEIQHPLGHQTVNSYSENHLDPLMRANLLLTRELGASGGDTDEIVEYGTEQDFHPTLPLPVRIRQIERTGAGEKRVLATITRQYNDAGDLTYQKQGSIPIWWVRTPYGEIALEVDGTGVVNANYRYSGFTNEQVSLEGSGLVAQTVEDADIRRIRDEVGPLNISLPAECAERKVAGSPIKRTTRYFYDAFGQVTVEFHPQHSNHYVWSKVGHLLAAYDTRSDLVVRDYNTGLRMVCQASRISPVTGTGSGAYEGEALPNLNGRFVLERYERDARGLVTRWIQSDEMFAGELAQVRYERNPDGSVRRRMPAAEPELVFEWDETSGLITRQYLEAEGEQLPIQTDMRYDAEGNLVSYKDDYGQFHSNRVDRLGRPFASIAPNGVVTEVQQDGANRVVRSRSLGPDGVVLDEAFHSYGEAGELQETRRRRMAWNDDGSLALEEWLQEGKYEYDAGGRMVRSRSVHEESWTEVKVDGLGREIERILPGGDREYIVYDGDLAIVHVSRMRHTAKDREIKLARFTYYDDRCAPWLTVPCPAEGMPHFERGVVSGFDTRGQQVLEARPAGQVLITSYNSSGRALRSVARSLDRQSRVAAIVQHSLYDAAGRKVSATLENKPLILEIVHSEQGWQKVRTNALAVPKVRRFEYDRFGRLTVEIEPDGLVATRTYGAGSLVEAWSRSRQGQTETLHYVYDEMRRLQKISKADDERDLQTFEYDLRGNQIVAADKANSSHPVIVRRKYDSMGAMLRETVEMPESDGRQLPRMSWTYDLTKGVVEQTLEGVASQDVFWRNRTVLMDGRGRVRRIGLDGRPDFVDYDYIGSQTVGRLIPESGLHQTAELSPFGEVAEQRWYKPSTPDAEAYFRFAYHYDSHGDLEAHEWSAPEQGMSATHLHAYDSFQRLSKEGVVRRLYQDRNERMKFLDECPERFQLEALRVNHMKYDASGNRTHRRQGRSEEFYSPAKPLQAAEIDEVKREPRNLRGNAAELVSDRLGAVAQGPVVDRTYEYDAMGRMTNYLATRDGASLSWTVTYDPFGRIVVMFAMDKAASNCVGKLEFASDAYNRRILKAVYSNHDGKWEQKKKQRTIYDGTRPVWVEDAHDSESIQQYFWGADYRDVVMAVLPRQRIERGGKRGYRRYFLHQNKMLDVFASTAMGAQQLQAYDLADYMGFGESATYATILKIAGEGLKLESKDDAACKDRVLDDGATKWARDRTSGQSAALLMELSHESVLQELVIWADNFPENFKVFVVPTNDIGKSVSALRMKYGSQSESHARVEKGTSSDRANQPPRTNNPDDPYRISLRQRKGQCVLILWDEATSLAVREFEVITEPPSSSSLAYAGAWRDEETGLYYQGARYRLPEMGGKFICPDPLGFVAGHNLYAYANNDPLKYYDPDGEAAQVLVGAGVGAVLGAGFYIGQVWWSDEEWDWAKLGIYTGAGALSGAAAAATFGASISWTAGAGLTATKSGIIASTLAGAVGGGAHGLATGIGITAYETGDWEAAFYEGGKSMLISGGLGALGGAVGGAVLSKAGASFVGTTLSGAAGGGVSGGVQGGFQGYRETGTFGGTVVRLLKGAGRGAAMGGAIAAGGWATGKASGLIQKLSDQPDIVDTRGLLVKTRRPESLAYGDQPVKPGLMRHHAKPISLGGSDLPRNIRLIPAESHRVLHPVGVRKDPYGTVYYK